VASMHTYRGPRGTSYRVVWRLPDGAQRSRSFKSRAEARDWRATIDRLEAAGQAPDPARSDVPLEVWAAQVIATLHLKPKSAEARASLPFPLARCRPRLVTFLNRVGTASDLCPRR